jgi:exo-beta-1,3-glucanase (GH17 family)
MMLAHVAACVSLRILLALILLQLVAFAQKPFHGLALGPYVRVNPGTGELTDAEIRRLVSRIAPYTNWIRTYGCDGELEKIAAIAREYGLMVAQGISLARPGTPANNANNTAQIACAARVARANHTTFVVAGNEMLFNGAQLSELESLLSAVRKEMPAGVTITTAETADKIIENPGLVDKVDVVWMHAFPFWNRIPIDAAVSHLRAAYEEVRQIAQTKNKSVIIGETGWQDRFTDAKHSPATPQNAARYLLEAVTWARTSSIPLFAFEAFDEPYKPDNAFGIWDRFSRLKSGMLDILQRKSSPDTWSGETLIGGSGSPTIRLTYVPPRDQPTGVSGTIRCAVEHVRPDDVFVVFYIRVAGNPIYYVKPFEKRPRTAVLNDGTCILPVFDPHSAEIHALLVRKTYDKEIPWDPSALPNFGSDLLASAMVTRTLDSIAGVVALSSGESVPEVIVTLTPPNGPAQTAVTTSGGEYSFYSLPAGQGYIVRPSRTGYRFNPDSVTVTSLSGRQTRNFQAIREGTTCTHTLNQTTPTIAYTGSTFAVTVSTGATCQWHVGSNVSWLQFTPASGVGTANVSIRAFPNFGTTARTGRIGIGTAILDVGQAGSPLSPLVRFLQLNYFGFFGRLPSDQEIAMQTAALQSISQSQFSSALYVGPENTLVGRPVGGIYMGLLDRSPEYDGWLFQRSAIINGGAAMRDIVGNFLTSEEYRLKFGTPDPSQFVALLYTYILRRAASSSDIQFHVATMLGGLSRREVAVNFLNSTEFRNRVDSPVTALGAYAGLLQRDASPLEYERALETLRSPGGLLSLMTSIIATPEFIKSLE